MQSYAQLHPQNPYFRKPPNIPALIEACPELHPYASIHPATGIVKLEWSSYDALVAFTKVLLWHDFEIQWFGLESVTHSENSNEREQSDFLSVSTDQVSCSRYLCPPLPNRLNYLCWLHDLIQATSSLWPANLPVHVLDIGVGANAIYPLLGTKMYPWLFTGSDVNPSALEIARRNVALNPMLQERIQLVLVPPSEGIQEITLAKLRQCAKHQDGGDGMVCDVGDGRIDGDNDAVTHVDRENASDSNKNTPFLLDPLTEILPNRGPVRNLLAHMNAHCQNRLADCEYQVQSLVRARHDESSDEEEEDLGRRKKARNLTEPSGQGSGSRAGKLQVSLDQLEYTPIITAVMCNPPFYDWHETVDNTGGDGEPAGHAVEMRTTGGEVAFVAAFIMDSLILRGSVLWYSSMVGRKASLGVLKTLLKQHGVPADNIVVTSLLQGQTYRWVLAWTFSRPAAVLYKAYAMLFVPTSATVFQQHKGEAQHRHGVVCTHAQFLSTMLPEELQACAMHLQAPSDVVSAATERVLSTLGTLEAHLAEQKYHHSLVHDAGVAAFVTQQGVVKSKPWEVSVSVSSPSRTSDEAAHMDILVFAQFQALATASHSINAVPEERRLLLAMRCEVRGNSVDGSVSVVMQCEQIHCSEALASRVFTRTKEYVEPEFLRTNRRWRRQLQRVQAK